MNILIRRLFEIHHILHSIFPQSLFFTFLASVSYSVFETMPVARVLLLLRTSRRVRRHSFFANNMHATGVAHLASSTKTTRVRWTRRRRALPPFQWPLRSLHLLLVTGEQELLISSRTENRVNALTSSNRVPQLKI